MSARPKALPKIKAPKALNERVITTIAAKVRKPFLQKLTKPVLVIRLNVVKTIV
jgi:hypothetical protein